ncbi:hypothetical protein GOODEAATRI_019861 [Goodea atripinnis]|uniref:Uncharacterized protein n=1 Tax=Goodea atripinnis TaxID=208336 RepID=A0ABV0N2T3_9TELE
MFLNGCRNSERGLEGVEGCLVLFQAPPSCQLPVLLLQQQQPRVLLPHLSPTVLKTLNTHLQMLGDGFSLGKYHRKHYKIKLKCAEGNLLKIRQSLSGRPAVESDRSIVNLCRDLRA